MRRHAPAAQHDGDAAEDRGTGQQSRRVEGFTKQTHAGEGGCGLGFPEAVNDPTFASLCAAWLPIGGRPDLGG